MAYLEGATGRLFGDRRQPLLVSVRSGAARSMPGMLDTVLDVGCTADARCMALVRRMTGQPRFAWDCRRRFTWKATPASCSASRGRCLPTGWRLLAAAERPRAASRGARQRSDRASRKSYQELIEDDDFTVPEDPMDQLESAAKAVYRSWMSDRARTYRRLEHLDGLHGTAVTVQAMVFGNRGLTSGAGVASRATHRPARRSR